MIKDFETVDKWYFDYKAEFEKIFENVHLFEPLDIAPSVLFEYFYVLYRNRCLGFPYDLCTPHPNNSYTISKVKNLLTIHSITNAYKYRTLIATMNFTYNPIENYNMTETHNTNFNKGSATNNTAHTGSDTLANSGTNSLSSDTTSTNTANTTDTLSSSTTTQIAPYNESVATAYDTNKVTVSGTPSTNTTTSGTTNTTNTETVGTSATTTYASSINTTEGARTDVTTETLSRNGNIGVTTTQQMIEQERNIADFDILKIYFNDIENLILLGEWS